MFGAMSEAQRKALSQTLGAKPAKAAGKDTVTEERDRYRDALDQILARPSYPVIISIASKARHPEKT